MKNKSLIAWVIIGLLALVVIILLLIANSGKKINWQEHYTGDSKDPYGEYVLQELLKEKYYLNHTIINKPLFRTLPQSKDSLNRNYLFIGSSLYLNKKDEQALFTFIENGNTALISANELPYSIQYALKTGTTFIYDAPIIVETTEASITSADTIVTDTLYTESEYADSINTNEHIREDSSTFIGEPAMIDTFAVIYNDSTTIRYAAFTAKQVTISFKHPFTRPNAHYTFLSPKQKANDEDSSYQWLGVKNHSEIFSKCEVLSFITNTRGDTLGNMFGIRYGKGMLYIHTNPIVFTNFYLKNRNGLRYAEQALSVVSDGKLYWDEFSKFPSSGNNTEDRKEYLKYILSFESLRWAWYLLLATTLLYILFKSKRKQAIIPVLEQVSNTSLEYVHTTGRLYAQIGNHRKLIQLNMRLFISMIHQKYGIIVKPEETASVQGIALKSGISAERYQELFTDFKKLTLPGNTVTSKDLHRFYTNMQFIYQKIHI